MVVVVDYSAADAEDDSTDFHNYYSYYCCYSFYPENIGNDNFKDL
jgi:hypothetical protein